MRTKIVPRSSSTRKKPEPKACRSLDELIEQVEAARAALRFQPYEECFYRGHSDTRWPLLPSLMRLVPESRRDAIESALFFEFQARARELHDKPLNDWDILQFMRHHGVATRLLDWTETFAVALWFATIHVQDGCTPCIWLLNPYSMNKAAGFGRDLVAPRNLGWDTKRWEYWEFSELLLDGGMDFERPVAIYPMQKSGRLQAQRGYFTIHGDDHRPLQTIAPQHVRRIPFDREVVTEARVFLDRAGIDHFLLFPDLDGLQRSLHQKYGI
jgi:hypothetical protein